MPTTPVLPDSAFDLGFAGPSDYEQLLVELINRARRDPGGEATRQGTPLASGVSSTPVEVLAVNAALDLAAQNHSDDMLADNFFAHDNPITGSDPFDRMRAAGYDYRAAGENIGWIGAFSGAYTAQRIEDHHGNLWDSAGHQRNLMSASFSEIGVGFAVGPYDYQGTTYPQSSMVTEKFGDRGLTFLTGVVIDDTDTDGFYDIGEGQGGVRITAWNATGTFATSTWDAGGYSLALAAGDWNVTFTGGDLYGTYTTTVTIGASNVKLDVIEAIHASPDEITLGTGADTHDATTGDETIHGLGGDDVILARGGRDVVNGGDGADRLHGNGGRDMLDGGAGNDDLRGGKGGDELHGGAGDDLLRGQKGHDRLHGGDGADVLRGGDGDDLIVGGLGDDILVGGMGADTFRFAAGHGSDKIRDFDPSSDVLRLDDALWGGGLTVQQVIDAHADALASRTVFSFAGGETVQLNGVTDLGDLLGAIEIF